MNAVTMIPFKSLASFIYFLWGCVSVYGKPTSSWAERPIGSADEGRGLQKPLFVYRLHVRSASYGRRSETGCFLPTNWNAPKFWAQFIAKKTMVWFLLSMVSPLIGFCISTGEIFLYLLSKSNWVLWWNGLLLPFFSTRNKIRWVRFKWVEDRASRRLN